MVRLIGNKAMNRIISRHQAVQFGVEQIAKDVARKAEADLAQHRDTGQARIELERLKVKYGRIDWFVSLVDEAAESIEFGHFVSNGNSDLGVTYVEGLHVIAKAAGLI